MAGIAAQFLVECENVLPVDTFQLEVFDQDGVRRSFTAGKGRMLGEGEPVPASVPPMLPGVHKRVAWHTIEHRLHAPADEGGGLLGVLRLWCDPRRLEPRDEALLASLVPHLASSLHRARLDREAKHDPLTGVLVRRVLERRLQELYRQSCEEGSPMAVILCDIDHFKRVNDTYGHDAGDQALIAVAQALDQGRRDHDLLCRYGGEEFTVLLEASTGELALQVAERLRIAVESLEVVYEGQRLPLRLSAGVAAFPELHVKTASELLLLADEALYGAKKGGRNRSLLHQGRGRFIDSDGRRYGDATRSGPDLPRVFQ
jgi:diguanylate cyclase (GGDEF)-like protein